MLPELAQQLKVLLSFYGDGHLLWGIHECFSSCCSSSGGADGPDRIFVGGLPYYLSEEQIMDLLSSFG